MAKRTDAKSANLDELGNKWRCVGLMDESISLSPWQRHQPQLTADRQVTSVVRSTTPSNPTQLHFKHLQHSFSEANKFPIMTCSWGPEAGKLCGSKVASLTSRPSGHLRGVRGNCCPCCWSAHEYGSNNPWSELKHQSCNLGNGIHPAAEGNPDQQLSAGPPKPGSTFWENHWWGRSAGQPRPPNRAFDLWPHELMDR